MRSPLILLTFDFIEGIFFFLPYKCLNILSFYIYPSFFFFFSFLFSLSMAVIYILFLCLSKTYLTLKSLFVKTIFVFFSLSTFWTNIASWANHRSASERGEERQNRKKKNDGCCLCHSTAAGDRWFNRQNFIYTHTRIHIYTFLTHLKVCCRHHDTPLPNISANILEEQGKSPTQLWYDGHIQEI